MKVNANKCDLVVESIFNNNPSLQQSQANEILFLLGTLLRKEYLDLSSQNFIMALTNLLRGISTDHIDDVLKILEERGIKVKPKYYSDGMSDSIEEEDESVDEDDDDDDDYQYDDDNNYDDDDDDSPRRSELGKMMHWCFGRSKSR